MPVGAGIAVVGGGLIQSSQAKRAQRAASRANKQAISSQNEMFNLLREDARRNFELQQQQQAPFREVSLNALRSLQDFNANPTDILNTPYVQDLTSFGTRALENSAAARGRLNTEETRRNTVTNAIRNLALPIMNNRFNQLSTVAGLGNMPAPQLNVGPAASIGAGIPGLYGNQGTINAQGALNQAGIIGGTTNNLLTLGALSGAFK